MHPPEWRDFILIGENKSAMIDTKLRSVQNGFRSLCLLLLGRPLWRPIFFAGASA